MTTPELQRVLVKDRARTALLISPVQQDHDFFLKLFQEECWALYSATSIASVFASLREETASVIITERYLPVGDWKDVLDATHLFHNPPLVIVVSRLADEYLWAEALNVGAYDVLAKPFFRTEVVRILNSAWNFRPRQFPSKGSRSQEAHPAADAV